MMRSAFVREDAGRFLAGAPSVRDTRLTICVHKPHVSKFSKRFCWPRAKCFVQALVWQRARSSAGDCISNQHENYENCDAADYIAHVRIKTIV